MIKYALLIFGILVTPCYADVNGIQHNHFRLAKILNLQKPLRVQKALSEEFKLEEGVIRIWAYAVTDNNSYLLRLSNIKQQKPKLLEFDEGNQKPLMTSDLELQARLQKLFDVPLDLENKGAVGATIQHAFIIETIKDGKYIWAYRDVDIGKNSDYSYLIDLLLSSTVKPIDTGWTIDIKGE